MIHVLYTIVLSCSFDDDKILNNIKFDVSIPAVDNTYIDCTYTIIDKREDRRRRRARTVVTVNHESHIPRPSTDVILLFFVYPLRPSRRRCVQSTPERGYRVVWPMVGPGTCARRWNIVCIEFSRRRTIAALTISRVRQNKCILVAYMLCVRVCVRS